MSHITYKELDKQYSLLHYAKEYEQALALLEREQSNFPEQDPYIYYMRICTSAMADKQPQALQLLKEVLDKDYWFRLDWLQKNPDLVSLYMFPEFKAVVEKSEQHLINRRAARKGILVLPIRETESRYPVLIAMHGNGSNATSTSEPWTGVAEHGWLVALLQSSQVVGQDAYVWDDRDKGTREVQQHCKNISADYNIDVRRIILGGFSMGGGQAVWMALHNSVRSFGFVVLAPYLTSEELDTLPALLAEHQPVHTRGYIIVGENDAECLPIARQIAEIMHNADYLCKLEIIPDLGHDYPADFSARVIKGLAFVEHQ